MDARQPPAAAYRRRQGRGHDCAASQNSMGPSPRFHHGRGGQVQRPHAAQTWEIDGSLWSCSAARTQSQQQGCQQGTHNPVAPMCALHLLHLACLGWNDCFWQCSGLADSMLTPDGLQHSCTSSRESSAGGGDPNWAPYGLQGRMQLLRAWRANEEAGAAAEGDAEGQPLRVPHLPLRAWPRGRFCPVRPSVTGAAAATVLQRRH